MLTPRTEADETMNSGEQGGRPEQRDFSNRRLGREALIYGAGTLASRAASFIMLPVYTRLLTPSDYGILQLLDMTVSVAAIVMSAGVTRGVMRFYFKAKTERERQEILGSAFFLELGLNVIGTLLMLAGAHAIWTKVLERQGSVDMVYLAAANFTLDVLTNIPLLKMQMDRKPIAFSVTSVSRVVLQVGMNIVFVVVFRWGVTGILITTLITDVLLGFATLVWLLRRTRLAVSRASILDLRRFGVPYQIATAAGFILTFGDRFFLQAFQGLAAVGIYGLAYQFGFVVSQAVTPFTRAWNPLRHQLAAESVAFREAKYNQGLRLFSLVTITAGVGINVLVRPVLQIMAAQSFWHAADIVPIIVAAYLVQAMCNVVQFGIDISERTKYVTYALWMAVGVIVVLYMILIPRIGAMGAAVATLVAFGARFAITYRFGQKLWPVRYDWRPTLRLAALGTVVTLLAFLVTFHSVVAQLLFGAALLLVFGLVAWFIALEPDERQMILTTAAKARTRILARSSIFQRG